MASATTTETFDCTAKQFYTIVSDYEKYPEFLNEVKKCKVVKKAEGKKLVEFEINVIKTFKYSLWMTEKEGKGLDWKLAEGDLFKTSIGSWKLEEKGKKCVATYSIDATFNMFVPGPIAKALVNVNLPSMMKAYHERVDELFG